MKTTLAVWVALAMLPLVAFAIPATLRIPPRTARTAPPPAQFSHATHDSQKCYACHPSIFPQQPQGFTHAEMKGGRYCGTCHDGGRATAITAFKCENCHVPIDGN